MYARRLKVVYVVSGGIFGFMPKVQVILMLASAALVFYFNLTKVRAARPPPAVSMEQVQPCVPGHAWC